MNYSYFASLFKNRYIPTKNGRSSFHFFLQCYHFEIRFVKKLRFCSSYTNVLWHFFLDCHIFCTILSTVCSAQSQILIKHGKFCFFNASSTRVFSFILFHIPQNLFFLYLRIIRIICVCLCHWRDFLVRLSWQKIEWSDKSNADFKNNECHARTCSQFTHKNKKWMNDNWEHIQTLQWVLHKE